MWSTHHQTLVEMPTRLGGRVVLVDADLVDLLRAVWEQGWETRASCQDWGDGTAQVLFCHRHDAIAFMHVAGFAVVRYKAMPSFLPDETPLPVHLDRRAVRSVTDCLLAYSDHSPLARTQERRHSPPALP